MLTCEAAETLIMTEVDGLLAGEEAAALSAHAESCSACRARRRASLEVARALSLRVDAPVPAGFAARVTARAFPGESLGWIDAINWRRWTEWMLPVAAALLMVAFVAGHRASTVTTGEAEATSSESTSAAADVWSWSGEADASTALSALSTSASSEDVLATMLGTSAAGAATEGKSNGR
jgi:predicted anti-sigma-YlaC factor YlaD